MVTNEPTYLYCAFIDVLGYKFYLERDRREGTLRFKDSLIRAMRCFSDVNHAIFSHQAISDSIIVYCTDRDQLPEFLSLLSEVFIGFLNEGMYIRGGLSYSLHYQNGNVTYSHAIARAYELENTAAIYPRIVVDNNVYAMWQTTGQIARLAENEIICESNGVFFVNILSSLNWQSAYDLAKKIYLEDSVEIVGDERVFQKHKWFQEYLLSSPFAINTQSYIPLVRIIEQ